LRKTYNTHTVNCQKSGHLEIG